MVCILYSTLCHPPFPSFLFSSSLSLCVYFLFQGYRAHENNIGD